MIYITGDTHGDMNRIVRFCERMETSQEDIMIILGDVGLNYYGDSRDRRNKEKVANLPITLFCIHGNHERRPTTIVEYKLQEWNGGKVWVEEAYPNILFAKDGEIYDIAGMKTIVIGGAYSVDKFYRLSKGYNWFEDEQPSDEIKAYVEQLAKIAHMSSSYFMSCFKQNFGLGAIEYLNQVRIRSACDLLRNTDRSISDIAFDTGFHNLSNFNRQFRTKVGCFPQTYRKESVLS